MKRNKEEKEKEKGFELNGLLDQKTTKAWYSVLNLKSPGINEI